MDAVGSNDRRSVDSTMRMIPSRFADDDGVIHGAYGYRWRTESGFNQLDVIVQSCAPIRRIVRPFCRSWICSMCDDLTLTTGRPSLQYALLFPCS